MKMQGICLLLLCLSFMRVASATDTDFGAWKGHTKFPGIKVRVRCNYYSQETDLSDWNVQFWNTYSRTVSVKWREEKAVSDAPRQIYQSAGLTRLEADAQSPIFTVPIKGTCERGGVYVSIDSIDDPAGGAGANLESWDITGTAWACETQEPSGQKISQKDRFDVGGQLAVMNFGDNEWNVLGRELVTWEKSGASVRIAWVTRDGPSPINYVLSSQNEMSGTTSEQGSSQCKRIPH